MEAILLTSQLYPWLFYLFVFVVSLMVGSFLNVVIHRLPIMMENSWKQEYASYFSETDSENEDSQQAAREQTIPETFNLAKPDSTCPNCGHKIRAWENIPIISYLLLRGKCSNCKTPISIRYPLVYSNRPYFYRFR